MIRSKSIAVLLAILNVAASREPAELQGATRVIGDADQLVTVTVLDRSSTRKLTLHCVRSCKGRRDYTLIVYDPPISIFVLDDSWPAMIATTWGAGDGYLGRAYRIDDKGFHLVALRHSCGMPFFGINDRDRFMVVTEEVHGYCLEWRYVTYYLTDKGSIRVPGFVRQR